MDFICVILFLVMYYIRPQEWSGAFATIHFVQIVMLTGLSTLFLRARGLNLRDLILTPHDWAVLAFWLWIVFTAANRWETFKVSASLYLFYVVIVQTLDSVQRIKVFVGWWTTLIVVVAGLALASQHGFDPLESEALTNGVMKGRLILNLSIFNNPNALGHSVVPAIPMLYYVCIWKRPLVWRALGTGLMVMVAYCIFLTASKGAFLSGFAATVATLVFGRPKIVQGAIICSTLMCGGAVLAMLPRMSELNKSKNDEAIQGRVMAFRHGYKVMTTNNLGVGYRNWHESFLAGKYTFKRTKFDKESLKRPMPIVSKAPHSSYVCIGAELGYVGFLLHMGVLYCCLRTLITAKTATPEEERIRRILFVLIVCYMASSWMVDFEYRPTYFMFAAATAALHRHLRGVNQENEREPLQEAVRSLEPALPAWRAHLLAQPALAHALAQTGAPTTVLTLQPLSAAEPEEEPASGIAFDWNRIGWVDLAIMLAMAYAAIRCWTYFIARM
jgi:hypothetical protein